MNKYTSLTEVKGTEKVTRQYFQSFTPDGALWCETLDAEECVRRSRGRNCTYRVASYVEILWLIAWKPDENHPETVRKLLPKTMG